MILLTIKWMRPRTALAHWRLHWCRPLGRWSERQGLRTHLGCTHHRTCFACQCHRLPATLYETLVSLQGGSGAHLHCNNALKYLSCNIVYYYLCFHEYSINSTLLELRGYTRLSKLKKNTTSDVVEPFHHDCSLTGQLD